MLSIGEFSQVTRLTVKTLRYYHELGILVPVKIDEMTGYRYYDNDSFNRANSIISLKQLGFSLKEIKTILEKCEAEEDLKSFIQEKISEIRLKASELKKMENRLLSLEEQIKTEEISASTKFRNALSVSPTFSSSP
ncbi:MAG: helix-turn-helix domain-containing protein [Spirochaetales bacterium]|nr:helix-turn-helix domain-containing protein [Spirochaetales bacterium]